MFSRYAHTAPLKFKTAEESATAIDMIFSKFRDVPILFSSDKGNEVRKRRVRVKISVIDKFSVYGEEFIYQKDFGR